MSDLLSDDDEKPEASDKAHEDAQPTREKLLVDIWKQAVDTQKHFNDMCVKSRQLGLTFVAASLGAPPTQHPHHIRYPAMSSNVMEQLGRAEVMIEIDSLRDLDLETTIRLRWVLRDIRARRAKLMAPSSDDLALLEERGLITMNDGEPELMDAANSIV